MSATKSGFTYSGALTHAARERLWLKQKPGDLVGRKVVALL